MNFSHKNLSLPIFILVAIFFHACSSSNYGDRNARYSRYDKKSKSSDQKKQSGYVYNIGSKSEKKDHIAKSEIILRDEIIMSAMNLTGRSYRSGGKSPETGFDCSGFTSFVFKQNGIHLQGSSDQQAKLGKHKSKSDLQTGDLVFFGNTNRISHVAIVVSNKNDQLEIVHSTTSAGVKIDNISHSEYWQSRLLYGVDILSSEKQYQ